MKLFIAFCLSVSIAHAASFVDPMKPPVYALIKMQQGKIKGDRAKKTTIRKNVNNKLKLQSVLIAKNRKVAIINEKLLGLGDRINGAKLIRISKNKVRLVKKGKVIDLKVNTNQSVIKITRSSQSK